MDAAALALSVIALFISFAAVIYARRQTLAAEKQNEIAERYKVPWRLEARGGSLFALVNDGECTEFDVDVVGPPHSAFSVRVDSTVVYPKSSVTFAFETSLATSGRNIEVSWARSPGGEKMHWSDWCPSSSQ